ncbi:MAG: peptide-methionine (R)-S-oxide reductase MsrB [Gemmatimonadota bacterium]
MGSSGKPVEPAAGRLGRRSFLAGSGAALLGAALWRLKRRPPEPGGGAPGALVSIVEFTDAGDRKGTVSVPHITKTEAEWKKQLSADSFEITREAGTERPFTGALLKVHDRGVFRCICCDTASFDSHTKFESGTGWPSFWASIAKENVVETSDTSYGMVRTAVSCRRCDAHLGHVFDDGPQPTGLRYCMNSVALRFAKAG